MLIRKRHNETFAFAQEIMKFMCIKLRNAFTTDQNDRHDIDRKQFKIWILLPWDLFQLKHPSVSAAVE
jgi:hypothetical protein